MSDLAGAVARLRRGALLALAARHGLENRADWVDFALRRRQLPAASAILRRLTGAGRLRRCWIWFTQR